ncbi:bifunctional ADP-dependent NAD(P)H-hydrate dehydratase/NAD(P)H-hydrate epimerase [Chitinilyticum litopenaei]|uniref:bifunctional ADP-dependent NAD(P)H-hydrate dehydratase/NAD(P)H-hydrate epimerase n=1 Tax=Chitinilyticum litopenaei TaxID=1121276 RepID=UPI0004207750|nr:bifunctional ADP-dependent NAD(P)H-hydrate dehydratase/NAD(P)H-hydrate epimerase [Chitinilyticum litopenaei]
MNPLHSSSAIRAIEGEASRQGLNLMAQAGLAAADWLTPRYPPRSRILILCGPGNNGGDGYVLADVLHSRQYDVSLFRLYPDKNYSGDAAAALAAYRGKLVNAAELAGVLGSCDVVIDAIFGIGIRGQLDPVLQQLSQRLYESGKPVVALDCPSGIDPDTGHVPDGAIHADATLTFIADKVGLHTGAALDYCGTVYVLPLQIAPLTLPATTISLLSEAPSNALLKRTRDTHKGRFGTLAILGGAAGMHGAAILAARAALFCGAGKIRVGLLDNNVGSIDSNYPEIMLNEANLLFADACDCIVAGPGLGTSPASRVHLRQALEQGRPLVLDADALNLLAEHPPLLDLLLQRSVASILTPHPLEAARLLNLSTSDVQTNRLHAAQQLARQYRSHIVLKGAGSVLVSADGQSMVINGSGNGALSCAGQGDILAGCIGALVAQGLTPWQAVLLGVHVHGNAGDLWRTKYPNGLGLTSGEVLRLMRKLLNHTGLKAAISDVCDQSPIE